MEKLDIFQDEVTLRTFVQKQFWHDIMWFCSDTWCWESRSGEVEIILAAEAAAAASIMFLTQWCHLLVHAQPAVGCYLANDIQRGKH